MYILTFFFENCPFFLPFLNYYKTHRQSKFTSLKSPSLYVNYCRNYSMIYKLNSCKGEQYIAMYFSTESLIPKCIHICLMCNI